VLVQVGFETLLEVVVDVEVEVLELEVVVGTTQPPF
jgi:hypothetical protein